MNLQKEPYLTFRVGGRMCAVPVKNVIEVAESSSINPLPGAPTFVAGIKKFRQEIVPIVDSMLRLSIPKVPSNDVPNKYAIMFEINTPNGAKKFGALVDKVLNVVDLNDNDIKIIETSKTSQTFSIGEKTYTFKVNKVELNYEKNGQLSADLSLEVSSGSTTCTGSYTQKVVNKDLCKAKPETDLEKIRNGFLPDSKRGSQSRVVDFYTVSNAPEFNNCLKSIVLD